MSKLPTPCEVADIKSQYPPGTCIELEHMVDAYGVSPGTRGSVDHVDDAGQIHMRWDNGRTLATIPRCGQIPTADTPGDPAGTARDDNT